MTINFALELNHRIRICVDRPIHRLFYKSTRLSSTLVRHHNKHIVKAPVRVRFAPSPTGHIHLGGLRAALYNYILARQHDGKFVLRIEDTDRARIVPGSAQEIERVLDWAGISPDESPIKGGPYGPYEQSKRLDIYREHANKLIHEGKAYRCFCSPERLDLLRKFQARNREKTRYDGKCKHLTPEDAEVKLRESDGRYVVRFHLMEGQDSFDDLVFGTVTNNLIQSLESDPIILKSDGHPTYHFANVVDDHFMEISHVLRGSEWISSTAKHCQLYSAFEWAPPKFIHLPLVTMVDGSKMSKRNNDSQVKSWIDAGYQPDTLFNFLTNSGGGVPKSKQDSNEFWTLRQLIDGFDFSQLTTHPGSLDANRLRLYSAKELQKAWSDDRQSVMKRYHNLLAREGIKQDISEEGAERVIGILISRLTSINDLAADEYICLWCRPTLTWPITEYTNKGWKLELIVRDLIETIEQTNLDDKHQFGGSLKKLAQKHGLDYSSFMRFVRRLLTNSERGLPVHEICTCLGRERLREYLSSGLQHVTG